jgi:hypothetical protein
MIFLYPIYNAVLIFGGKNSLFYHEPNINETYKKRILESLLLMPWFEIMTNELRIIMSENFSLKKAEIDEVIFCFHSWLTLPDSQLPFPSLLEGETHKYWNNIRNYHSGWGWLAKLSLIFCNTSPSESNVEREFSLGRLLTGDRRHRLSSEHMDIELILND